MKNKLKRKKECAKEAGIPVQREVASRLTVAGMGDALATYFEARACQRSEATSCAGGNTTGAAMALAELCFDTLMEEGVKAKIALEAGVCTPAVEKIIEANALLSGIGFESAGLAGAHAIHNGLTVLEECHHMYHGEKVAFGTLAQLVLENVPLNLYVIVMVSIFFRTHTISFVNSGKRFKHGSFLLAFAYTCLASK